MSVKFRFSAGDFIAALSLVKTVIDALQDEEGAGAEHKELIRELLTLESSLLRVEKVELDDSQVQEGVALQQATCQFQWTIDYFWQKVRIYQPALTNGGPGSRMKDGWMKIRWAVCRKDVVMRFRAELNGHTASINLLLMAIHT